MKMKEVSSFKKNTDNTGLNMKKEGMVLDMAGFLNHLYTSSFFSFKGERGEQPVVKKPGQSSAILFPFLSSGHEGQERKVDSYRPRFPSPAAVRI
jgi:hypothetical protein